MNINQFKDRLAAGTLTRRELNKALAAATLLLVGTVVVSDSSQYYTGRILGRRPLAPAISPKKTVEGALGGARGAADRGSGRRGGFPRAGIP